MKKTFHKLILAILTAAFILTLAGCGSDDALKKNIVGSWVCRGIDVSDMILESMRESAGDDPETEELFRHLDVGVLTMDYLLDIHEDGTFVLTIDQSSAEKLVDQLSKAIADAMYTYLEDTIKKLLEENGMTMEEMLTILDCKDMDEVIQSSMGGQTMDEYVDQLFTESDIQGIFEEGTESGTYSVKSGKILLSATNSAVSLIEYEEETDTISLTESGFDEPFLFVRH